MSDIEQQNLIESLPIEECELARAIYAVGDRWVLLILREALCGIQRFSKMQTDLKIPKAVLTDRLNQLLSMGVLEQVPYREPGMRTRRGYALTSKGRALIPALLALREWANSYLPGKRSRLRLVTFDGAPVVTKLVRQDVLTIVDPLDVRSVVCGN
jgi:DNA-binding HxlR family transcriptional regulator